MAISEHRLYRESYGTLEEYCRERWNLTRQHVNRQLATVSVMENLGTMVPSMIEGRYQCAGCGTLYSTPMQHCTYCQRHFAYDAEQCPHCEANRLSGDLDLTESKIVNAFPEGLEPIGSKASSENPVMETIVSKPEKTLAILPTNKRQARPLTQLETPPVLIHAKGIECEYGVC